MPKRKTDSQREEREKREVSEAKKYLGLIWKCRLLDVWRRLRSCLRFNLRLVPRAVC